tara:strand:+ start:3155 stop:4891 length:1737 start_codon:yes stop_codon:yes gene_type:complete
MAEKIVSPGVYTRESDQSQITEGPIIAEAAIVGPTTLGPVEEPTIVTSYSDYKSKFGGALESASQRFTFFNSLTAHNFFKQGGETLLVTRTVAGTYTEATSSAIKSGSSDTIGSFTLATIPKGTINNSSGPVNADGVLHSGSADNIRWEVSSRNVNDGTFNLLVRRGNDTIKNKAIVEQFTNLSLDPFSPNYIEKVIGNQTKTLRDDENNDHFLQITGSYENKSRYVYVSTVTKPTPNYLDSAGVIGGTPAGIYSASLPLVASGTFGDAEGTIAAGALFSGDISSVNTQGIGPNDYTASISLLKNKDLYNYNVLAFPGLISGIDATHNEVIDTAISAAEDSGDSLVVFDAVEFGTTSVSTVTTQAENFNTSYAATYWPWLQVEDVETGKRVFVPASVMMPGVYAFNDKSKDPWFAPAGLNRGALPTVIRAEKALTKSERDTLYEGKVNPIATFANSGVVVFGQKTLQKQASALDRVNVRRLLIALKRFVGGVGTNLVFEQNTTSTRNSFLSQVNPYLESVQQRQGLYAFKVVMDSSNNTADVIDRNQLIGQVFIQPAKTAEFIILDFNILPTGVSFPS